MQNATGFSQFLSIRCIILSCFLTLPMAVYTQDTTTLKAGETYLVDPGVHPGKVIPISKQYRYPGFRNGRIFFSTGKQSEPVLLNYNLLYDAIQIKDPKGDTVWLDKTLVKFVQIDTDYYFSDLRHGYFRLITSEGPIALMILSRWVLAGKYSINSQWETFETPQTASRVEDFYFPSQYTRFVKADQYFLKGPTDKVYQPSKQSLIKIFPDYKKAIRRHFSTRKIDLKKEADLKELVAFCNGLVEAKGHK